MPEQEKKSCPVCGSELSDFGNENDGKDYDCLNCGKYALTRTALAFVKSRIGDCPRFGAVLSYSIRKMQRHQEWPKLDSSQVKRIEQEVTRPDVMKQAGNFVLWLGDNLPAAGIYESKKYEHLRAVLGSFDVNEVAFVISELKDRGIVDSNISQHTLTFKGWEWYHQLKHKSSESSSAFMAMDYKNKNLTTIFLKHFKPAVVKTGFSLERLDERPKAGLIDQRLRVEIRRARFLVVDLTDSNLGAYWEAGFAEGLGKPVIYTCEEGVFDSKGTHFDTNHLHTVKWNFQNPERAAEELKNTIRATLPDVAKMSDD